MVNGEDCAICEIGPSLLVLPFLSLGSSKVWFTSVSPCHCDAGLLKGKCFLSFVLGSSYYWGPDVPLLCKCRPLFFRHEIVLVQWDYDVW